MRSTTPAVLLLAGLLGSTAALPARAETAPTAIITPAPAPDSASATKADDAAKDAARAQSEAADRAAFFDAHLAALHAGLALTPEQEKLWPPLDQAIRGFAKMRMSFRDAWADRRQDREEEGYGAGASRQGNPVDVLKATSERLLQRGKVLADLADAAAPLYTTLSEDQKRRLPFLLQDIAPAHGPIGRFVAALGGEDHPREEECFRRDRGDFRQHDEDGADRRSDFDHRDFYHHFDRDGDRRDEADRSGWDHYHWWDRGRDDRDRGYRDHGWRDRDHRGDRFGNADNHDRRSDSGVDHDPGADHSRHEHWHVGGSTDGNDSQSD